MTMKNFTTATPLHQCARTKVGHDGFTYVELTIALALLTLSVAGTFPVLTQANTIAVTNRAHTCAEILVQNEIDAFLTAAPFYPQFSLIPAELVTGTTTQNNVAIYTDSSTGDVVVSGTLTRTVADLGLTQTTNSATQNLQITSETVTLNYTFRGKAYSVSMSTLRTSDS
jgi:type II secretory pathway pseudopilin PulG